MAFRGILMHTLATSTPLRGGICTAELFVGKKKTLHQALHSAKDFFFSTKYDFFSWPIEVVIAWSLLNSSLTIAILNF